MRMWFGVASVAVVTVVIWSVARPAWAPEGDNDLQPTQDRHPGVERRVIQPERFPATGLPYSPGILAGDTLYLSGQLGRDPETAKLVPGGIEPETRQVLANLREVLRAAGMDFEDVTTVTSFLVSMDDFAQYNAVYREHFPVDPPARATVAVSGLNLGARIELQMTAVRTRR
jgi:2-iminobutanoate/2-iminopropanoate deaminase